MKSTSGNNSILINNTLSQILYEYTIKGQKFAPKYCCFNDMQSVFDFIGQSILLS